jgi:hypothetical protein
VVSFNLRRLPLPNHSSPPLAHGAPTFAIQLQLFCIVHIRRHAVTRGIVIAGKSVLSELRYQRGRSGYGQRSSQNHHRRNVCCCLRGRILFGPAECATDKGFGI